MGITNEQLKKRNEEQVNSSSLYSLISLDEFKSLMGIDDREDRICRFCLLTATLTIEQYCKRKFLRKKYFETVPFDKSLTVFLQEYPVDEVLAVYLLGSRDSGVGSGELLETEFYRTYPDCGNDMDICYSIEFSPALLNYPRLHALKVIYIAGYNTEKIPTDLSSACLELSSWNINRYRGKRIGMSGNIKGAGIQGEHFELSMLENVKALIEPYKRKVI